MKGAQKGMYVVSSVLIICHHMTCKLFSTWLLCWLRCL
jgi:hypothetical protein